VPFTAYNVDEDDRAYDALLARGHRTIPVTVFDHTTIIGFDPASLAAAAAEWRRQTNDRAQP
jgi:hypothetical protein